MFKRLFRRKPDPKMIERQLRGEALGVAMSHAKNGMPQSVEDTVRGAALIYDFVEHGKLPAEPTTTA